MLQSENELDWNNLLNIIQKFKQDYELEKNELLLKIEELQTENKYLQKQNQLQKRQLFLLRRKIHNQSQNYSQNIQTLNTENFDDQSQSNESSNIENEIEQQKDDIDLNQILQEFDIQDILKNLKDEQQKIIVSENTSFSKSFVQQEQDMFVYQNHLDCVRDVKYIMENKNDFLISVAEDGLIVIQDLNDIYRKKILRSHLGPIFSLCFDYEKDIFFTAGCEGWISIWEKSSKSIQDIQEPKNIYLFNDIVYSIDVNNQYNNKVLATSREKITLIYDYISESINFKIDENYIISKYDQIQTNQIIFLHDSIAQVDFYDISKQKFFKKDFDLQSNDQINCIDFNIDRESYLLCSDYGKLLLYSQKDNEIQQRYNYNGFASKCQFIDNYRFIVVGQNGLCLYDIRQQECILQQQIGCKKFQENITSIDLHQSTNYAYLGCANGFIYKTEINQFQKNQISEINFFYGRFFQVFYCSFSVSLTNQPMVFRVKSQKVTSCYYNLLFFFLLLFQYLFQLFF